jgi:hypothetical protein
MPGTDQAKALAILHCQPSGYFPDTTNRPLTGYRSAITL